MRQSLEEFVRSYRRHELHVAMIRELTRGLQRGDRRIARAHERKRDDVRALVDQLAADGFLASEDADAYLNAARRAREGVHGR